MDRAEKVEDTHKAADRTSKEKDTKPKDLPLSNKADPLVSYVRLVLF
ncbi:hypothetical protein [Lysinibacillus sp. F5]|nr:hypothetical protein [Lysinibacillus sp. F5]